MIMMMIIWLIILITATNCSNDMVMMTTNAMMMVKRMMVIIMTKVHFCLVSSDTCFLGVWHNYLTEMGLWVQHNFYFWESCSKKEKFLQDQNSKGGVLDYNVLALWNVLLPPRISQAFFSAKRLIWKGHHSWICVPGILETGILVLYSEQYILMEKNISLNR